MGGFQSHVQNLYDNSDHICELTDKKSPQIFISAKEIEKALKNIYQGLEVKNKIERTLFENTLEVLNKATDEGFGNIEYGAKDDAFLQEIKTNNAVFAAFKTHRQQKDLAKQLIDKDDQLKSFAQFKKDTATTLGNYNQNWLQTEYNTAITRARTAQQFKQFAKEKYLFPNLECLPSMAANPREAHKVFYNRVWAQDDPFWNTNTPGSIWGCKCGIKSTDAPLSQGEITEDEMPTCAPGLDNNPVKDGKLFSNTHPYVAKAYPGAKKAVAKHVGSFIEAKTAQGKVRYHTLHGKNERAENTKIATHFANKYGHEIDLLSILQDKKTPDVFNKTVNQFQEYKTIKEPTKSAIDNAIRVAKTQAAYVILKIDAEMSEESIAGAIQNRVRRSKSIKEITLLKNGKDKTYTREDILNEHFTL